MLELSMYTLRFIHLYLVPPAIVSLHSSFFLEILVVVFSLRRHDWTHLYDIVVQNSVQ